MGRGSTYLVVQGLAVLRVCDHAVQTLQADVTPILLLHPLLTLQGSSATLPHGCRPETDRSAIMHRSQGRAGRKGGVSSMRLRAWQTAVMHR